jgi:hypothetical protein
LSLGKANISNRGLAKSQAPGSLFATPVLSCNTPDSAALAASRRSMTALAGQNLIPGRHKLFQAIGGWPVLVKNILVHLIKKWLDLGYFPGEGDFNI